MKLAGSVDDEGNENGFKSHGGCSYIVQLCETGRHADER